MRRTRYVLFGLAVSMLTNGSAWASRQAADSWTSVTPMSTPRVAHSATLLADGRVFVARGCQGSWRYGPGFVQQSEIYNPGTGVWSPAAGGLADGRCGQAAVRLVDGRVLVVGGAAGPPGHYIPAEVYDPGSDMWTATGPGTPSSQYGGAPTVLSDGRVLFVGQPTGSNDPSPTVGIYDPATNTWSSAPPMLHAPTAFATATRLRDGRVLVVGDSQGVPEIFDPTMGNWSLAPSPNTPRRFGQTLPLNDGRVLVVGNVYLSGRGTVITTSAEVFDPAGNGWKRAGRPVGLRSVDHALRLGDGTVLALGPTASNLLGASVYDPRSSRWSPAAVTALRRSSYASTVLQDGRVLITGGSSCPRADDDFGCSMESVTLSDASLYQPRAPKPMLTGLSITPQHFAAATSGPAIARRLGATLRFSLNEPATVRLSLSRTTSGRRAGPRCVAVNPANRGSQRCARNIRVAPTLQLAGKPGRNHGRFLGRLRHRPLAAGSYRLTAIPYDPAGKSGAGRHTRFQILP
jgi:hypothetical protein